MTPVSVEAAKNTRNAAAKMYKTLLKEKQKLHAELKAKKRELNFFDDVTNALTSTSELNKILSVIIKKIKTMTEAKACFVIFVNEKGVFSFEKILERKSKKTQQKFNVTIAEDIIAWIKKKDAPIIVSDVSKETSLKKKIDKLLHIKTMSLMCAPVKIQSKIVGALVAVNKLAGKSFTELDIDLLSKLVKHIAVAIERAFLYQKIEELTITDELTNLFNLRYLNRAIGLEIERSNRHGTSFTLIFMDIDSLKKINDQHGHLIGSKVLVETAQLLSANLRAMDVVARYGGDEFVIVLPQTSMENGFQVAERLRKKMEKHVFLRHEGYTIKLTASFGVASYPDNARSKEELFRIADEALYRGKFSTKNIVYAAVKPLRPFRAGKKSKTD